MSSMVLHKNLKDDDSHADVARTFATIAARDLDTTFSSAATNINKNVRVDSPLTIFKLMDVAPTWLDLGQTPGVLATTVLTNNFLIRGDGLNTINRVSTDGISGIFTNDNGSELAIRPPPSVTEASLALLGDDGIELFKIRTNTTTPSLKQIIIAIPDELFWSVTKNIDIQSSADFKIGAVGQVFIQVTGLNEILLERFGGDDTTPVVRFRHTGTNAASIMFFVGNRGPLGNVTGEGGDLYFSENSANSKVFINKGAGSNNTGWKELETAPERIAFTTDTTTAALGVFQIFACTDTSTQRTITISTSTITLGTPTLPHRFTIKDETSNARNNMILIFTESGLIDGNTMTSISTDDGAKMFYVDGTNVFIESEHENPLDAVTFTGNSFNVQNESTNPQSMVFSANGLRAFVLDFATNNIFQYNLTLPFSMASGNVVFSTFSQNMTAEDITSTTISWNTDGTKLFMAGQASNAIHEFTLSIGFDLSSTFVSTGNNFNFNAQEGLAASIEWKPDGTKFFLVGRQNNTVFEYNVSTPFDVLTASFSGNSFSVFTEAPAPESIRFSPDGKRFFISGTVNQEIFQYNLTTPFSLASGVTFSGFSFDSSGQGTIATSIAFKPDGTKMFLLYSVPNASRHMFEYDVSPAFSMEGA